MNENIVNYYLTYFSTKDKSNISSGVRMLLSSNDPLLVQQVLSKLIYDDLAYFLMNIKNSVENKTIRNLLVFYLSTLGYDYDDSLASTRKFLGLESVEDVYKEVLAICCKK